MSTYYNAMSKLLSLYYYFKVGYDNGIADDLEQYILTEAELVSLQITLKEDS